MIFGWALIVITTGCVGINLAVGCYETIISIKETLFPPKEAKDSKVEKSKAQTNVNLGIESEKKRVVNRSLGDD